MCLRALVKNVPVWLVSTEDPEAGRWLRLEAFPQRRMERIQRELGVCPALPEFPGLFDVPPE